ncbi:MAG: SRPBCC family protein [Sphingobacteriaceae bacterium]|nr:MAG: SRPBCC family protein [Sphingobacteriaceae bacterium]
MTVIESNVTLNATAASTYNFLADLNNHQQLMPENITDWTSTKDEARFNIQNMAKLILQVASRNPQEILINAIENPPFPLQLKWTIKEAGNQTEVSFTISAELNMMMKMLAKSPLQKLADYETQRLKDLIIS